MGRRQTRQQIWTMRRTDGAFSAWPRACGKDPNFYKLSMKARSLMFELLGQLRGDNNGDLTCAFKVLGKRGWNSRTTIEAARQELETTGWIVKTRTGFRNRCNLYALTFYAIDDCDGKLEVPSTVRPLEFWKEGHNPWLAEGLLPKLPPQAFSKSSSRPTLPKTRPNGGQATKRDSDGNHENPET